MNNNYSNEALDWLFYNAPKKINSKSLEKCSDLFSSLKSNKKVLAFGEVQSGKTRKIISLINEFSNEGSLLVIFFTGLKNNLLHQNHDRLFSEFENENKKFGYEKFVASRKENVNDININRIQEILSKGKTYITSELKTPEKIRNLANLINSIQVSNILIIDDEGDEATFGKSTKPEFDKLIENENLRFLSITASPYKNLYFFQKEYDDFIYLESSENYCGIDTYENIENFYVNIDKANYENYILISLSYWVKKIIENKINDSQILFNTSLNIGEHKFTYKFINKFLSYHGKILRENLVMAGHLTKEENEFIVNNLNHTNVILSNSSETKEITKINNAELQNGFKIIIGGGNLSRGMTYDNLMVEVMLNSPKDPDPGVLLQRARWFGYKKDNIKNMKVFITREIKISLTELSKLNEYMKNFNLEKNFKEDFINFKFKKIKIGK